MPRDRDRAPSGSPGDGGEAPTGPGDGEPPQWLAIELVIDSPAWSAVPEVERLVRAAAAGLARNPACSVEAPALACIALADDATVRALNREHRGKDGPTNVLSFPAPDDTPADEPGRQFLGDVILAAETVLAEAQDQEIAPAHHVQHLVVHGLLHLLGHDHEADAEAETMEAIEIAVLAGLGVANPYLAPR